MATHLNQKLNIQGLKYLKHSFAIICVALLFSSCAANKAINQNEALDSFKLDGLWVIVNDDKFKNDIFFDFRQSASNLKLTVLGRQTELQNFRENGDQVIFTYDVPGEESFNVLVTKLANDRIKFSQVTDAINSFHPVGKLGEKVYHMQKMSEGELKLMAGSTSQKQK